MGSLILGSLGSSLLGPVGGMIGGQAGSMLDNMLFNHKYIRKPALQDLIVEAATMGLPIPIVYGREKLAGNLIQSNLLQASKHSGKGGMMGGSKGTPYYTYNVTCAVAICRGPIRNIWRIFADSKLIWDMDPSFAGPNTHGGIHPFVMSGYVANQDGSGGTAILYHYGTGKHSNDQVAGSSVRFYFGVEGAQQADPALASIAVTSGMSASEQPAYQGIAYAVFNGLPLADFGNRIPNFQFEVNGFYSGPTNVITTPAPPFTEGLEGKIFYDTAQNVLWTLNNQFITAYDANSMAVLYEEDLSTNAIILAALSPTVAHLAGAGLDTASYPFNNAMAAPDGTFWTVYSDLSSTGSPGIIVNFNPQGGVIGAYPILPNSTSPLVANLSYLTGTSNLPPPLNPPVNQPVGPGPSIICGSKYVMFVQDTIGHRWQAYSTFLVPPGLVAYGDYPGPGFIKFQSWSENRSTMVAVTDQNTVFTFSVPDVNIVGKITGPLHPPFNLDPTYGNYSVLYDPSNDVFVFTNGRYMYAVTDITTFTPVASLDLLSAYGFQNLSWDCFSVQQTPHGSIALIVQGTPTAQSTPVFDQGHIQIGAIPGPGPGKNSGDGQSGGGTGGGMIYILNSLTLQEVGGGVLTDGWSYLPAQYGVGPACVFNSWGNGCLDYKPLSPVAGWAEYKPNGYPITLGLIVKDICVECGLAITQIDTTALDQIIVYGYMITQEASGRAALEPLQEMYQFDMVEIDGVLTAKLRAVEAANVLINIDETDLGARSATADIGANPQPKVIETRRQDIELPQYVFLRYKTIAHDFYVKDFSFAVATQYAKRAISPLSTVYGLAHQSISSTIVLSDQNAANIVLQILLLQYLNRNEVQFSLPIKYIALTPGDVVNLSWHDTEGNIVSYPIYVRQVDLGADNTLKVEGVSTNGSVYTASQVPGTTFPGTIPIPSGQPSTVDILETPPLRDSDDTPGFYWGACGIGSSPGWGCNLVSSVDGGQSFGNVGSDIFPADLGAAVNILGAAPSPDTVGGPVPGIWDPVNSVIIKLIGGPPMAGVTPEQVLNHQNIFLVGKEIIGAANAVLNSDGTYTLSLLQRGLLGTDIFINTHAAGERVARLAADGTILNNTMNVGALNQIYLYAGISNGSDITNSKIFQYALQGTRIRPEAVCNVSLQRDGANNAMITWVPRNRIGYEWIDGVEQGVDEPTEAYQIDIFSGIGTLVNTLTDWDIGLMTVGNTPNADSGVRMMPYSAAQQAIDGLVGAGEAWNPLDLFQMTLTGANLTATNLSAGAAAVRASTSATTGRYYWEFTPSGLSNNSTSIGVADATYALSTQSPSTHFKGVNALTGLLSAQTAGLAFDLHANVYWTRQSPSANWNGSPTADPAAGVGGIGMGLLSGLAVFPCFVSFSNGESGIANFGGSAFAGIVPSGFSPGWPGPLPPRITATIYEMSTRVGRGFPRTIVG